MTISREQVLTVAHLARLHLDDSTADALTEDLDRILGYVTKLQELDTSAVEPTAQVTVDSAPLRQDEPVTGLDKETVLKEAPRADGVGFLVPGFVDES